MASFSHTRSLVKQAKCHLLQKDRLCCPATLLLPVTVGSLRTANDMSISASRSTQRPGPSYSLMMSPSTNGLSEFPSSFQDLRIPPGLSIRKCVGQRSLEQ